MLVVSIGKALANVSVELSQFIAIQNPHLHKWYNSSGDLGLSYSSYSYQPINESYSIPVPTSFQYILQNVSQTSDLSPSIAGFDFRNPQSPYSSLSSINSSLQLGKVSNQFNKSIEWISQPINTPNSQNFFIQDFEFCGNHLLSNFSYTWPVIMDTGSVCITLPSEIYDTFVAWFDNTTLFSNPSQLPALTFRISNFGETPSLLYIPLSEILISSSAIESERGAPAVQIKNPNGIGTTQQRLCVLRGASILYNGNSYANPPQSIIFGSLAFRSLYVGLNYENYGIGLANKLNQTEINSFNFQYFDPYAGDDDNNYRPVHYVPPMGCNSPAVCVGDQTYNTQTNSCEDPNCSLYFFNRLNIVEHTCEFNSTPYVFGVIFIIVITVLEVVTFLISQYSAKSVMPNHPFDGNTVPRSISNLWKIVALRRLGHLIDDFVFNTIGRWLSHIGDVIVIYVLRLVEAPTRTIPSNGNVAPNGSHPPPLINRTSWAASSTNSTESRTESLNSNLNRSNVPSSSLPIHSSFDRVPRSTSSTPSSTSAFIDNLRSFSMTPTYPNGNIFSGNSLISTQQIVNPHQIAHSSSNNNRMNVTNVQNGRPPVHSHKPVHTTTTTSTSTPKGASHQVKSSRLERFDNDEEFVTHSIIGGDENSSYHTNDSRSPLVAESSHANNVFILRHNNQYEDIDSDLEQLDNSDEKASDEITNEVRPFNKKRK